MKKQLITLCLTGVVATNVAFAKNNAPNNFITYPVFAKNWVTTKTANVTIAMNANVSEKALATLHQRVMQKLEKIAKVKWHITQFLRNQDSSGLEKVVIQAVARLQSNQLSMLKTNAEKVSAPGEKFQIQSIAFKPTSQEFGAVRAELRATVYRKAKAEIASLDKVFPEANYQLYSVDFMPVKTASARPMNTTMFVGMANEKAMSVGNQLTVAAVVKLQPRKHK